MRLGQLGRKLSLRPAEIVEFLASNNILIGNGSNTRIEDAHALLVINHFAPGQENLLKEDDIENEMPEQTLVAETAIEAPQTHSELEPVQNISDEVEVQPEIAKEEESISDFQSSADAGVIKAPKVELPGLKVLGKIELPEPKKKEIPADTVIEHVDNSDNTESLKEQTPAVERPVEQPRRVQREDRRAPYQKRERSDIRQRKNPIALQREREALEAEQRRKEEIEKERERRTQNYLKKVKVVQPTKAAKLNREAVVDISSIEDEKPKSWFGKLMQWLTKA
jgi:hypothetical protein